MREAVIVSYARTGMAKANRGSLNNTHGITMAGTAIKGALDRAGIEAGLVEDVFLGCAQPEGATGHNVARNAALWAGCPSTTSGATINRFCSSGLQAIANAAHTVINEGAPVAIGGGVESLSLVSRSGHMNLHRYTEDELMKKWPAIWMTMIETAEIVADRYGVSREYQDEYSAESQKRTAAFQEKGYMAEEIVPLKTTMKLVNKETGEETLQEVVCDRDECNRPGTTFESLSGLKPVFSGGMVVKEGKYVTAGNASQLSDGSAAVVVMEAKEAEKRGLKPLGRFVGFNVAGCDPDEMGIGPVFAVPRLLERHGLKVDDIDLWELNEAFASQCLYSRDRLGIDPEKYNVNGGSISIG
ncbi:MAG TPA: acetyl-CoA C-acyltransferase, partial [Hyphomonas sp.]|nr:acetyl-CoA C-acyltransferase [Hyphomonas sp.]